MAHVARLREKPSCETCRKIYKNRGKHPPCRTCLPELMEENADAVRAWGYCQDQYVMGFNGPVAIRLEAMEAAVRIAKADDPDGTLDKLVALARSVIADMSAMEGKK